MFELPKHDHAFADIEGDEPDIRMWNEASMHAYAHAGVAAYKRENLRTERPRWKPDLNLLCKLGSIAIHAQELTSPDGHEFDAAALRALLADPEVVAWLTAMDREALLPKRRCP